jgi:dTDP-4-amino-4,6-dideoxygalactose transaminase
MTKENIEDLACFDGKPAFDKKLHVGQPNIGDRVRFINRVDNMLDRHWLTNDGPFVQEFERKIAKFLGVKHCIAMCNATIALEIAIRALGLNGEVIIPSFTFVATAHALQWQEITPVFCDVDPLTHNINPASIEKLITPHTTGILGVHVWGRACDIETLTTISRRHKLKLIFDAAHAFACTHRGEKIGNFGDVEVFSFHATKFFNSFEGGAIATNNDILAKKARDMRNFGFSGFDTVISVGTNGKMSEVSAAMGLTSLESLDEFMTTNKENYKFYKEELKDIAGVFLTIFDEKETNNYQYIVIEVDEEISGISRDNLLSILHAENILARRYFYPGVHQMEPYQSYFPNARLLLPETEKLTKKVLQLPTGTAIDKDKIIQICQIIRLSIENAADINEKIRA